MQPEKEKKKDSKLLFLEKATWKRGREIITVLLVDEHGRKHNIAHIYLEYSKELGKRAFVVSDAKGMGILPPSENLYELKKKLIALEPHLAQTLKERLLAQARERGGGKENEITR